MASMRRRYSTPGSRSCAGVSRSGAGSSGPTATTRSKRNLSSLQRALSARPSFPASPASRHSRAKFSHHAVGLQLYGQTNGNRYKLGDQRVAIIGTGATAIQCVPFVGKYAKHTYVFQRTPSSVDLRGNKPTDPKMGRVAPGWLATSTGGEFRRNYLGPAGHRGSR
jgi:hypothetical protein